MATMPLSHNAKLEPRLIRQLEAAKRSGLTEQPIPILIELAGSVRAQKVGSRQQAMKALEQRSHRLQKALVARLVELGARNIHQAGIVNAVSAELAPAQIRLIADHPDIHIIRLSQLERVTAPDQEAR